MNKNNSKIVLTNILILCDIFIMTTYLFSYIEHKCPTRKRFKFRLFAIFILFKFKYVNYIID